MNTNQIFIFGVGRSGTTALYNLLQYILDDVTGSYSSIYEPFLWEREVFDRPLSTIRYEFSETSSLSIDGMYANKHIPMFLDDESSRSYLDNSFVNSLVKPAADNEVLLAKYIRASGRAPLFRRLAPEARFIYVMRNPLDVINSSVNMFSFFGGDFYASDFDRFIDEVNKKKGGLIEFDESSREQREFLYWYYMNQSMTECYEASPKNAMPIVYENYLQDKAAYIKNLCEFIGVEYKEDYLIESNRIVGQSFANSNLTASGYEFISSNLHLYENLVSRFDGAFDKNKLLKKYESKKFSKSLNENYREKTAPYLRKQLLRTFRGSLNLSSVKSAVELFKHNIKK